jgi:hypothetical protein
MLPNAVLPFANACANGPDMNPMEGTKQSWVMLDRTWYLLVRDERCATRPVPYLESSR